MRYTWVAVLFGALLSILPDLAAAEPRIALIIANGNYKGDIGSLKNPVGDGKLMGDALRKVGFTVNLLTDGDQRAMKKALNDFGQALAEAGPTATGLFYYAGHGLQVSGENYLVPVGANIKREGDVELEALSAEAVLKVLNFSGSKIQIVILDACRNNPLMRSFRSGSFGLAKIDAPIGSFVAYSTAPGSVAADGKGSNSPFAAALATEVQKPGASIEEMFRNVRAKVIAETDSQQVPWDSSSLTAPFYFSKDFSAAGSTAAMDQMFWDSIKDSSDPADFKAYIAKFPKGTFVELADNRLQVLRKAPPEAQPTQTAAVTEPSQPKSLSEDAPAAQLTPPSSNLKPGTVFRDCKDCPEMVVIPAGSFMMGSPDGEAGRASDEGPQHKETIPRAIAFSKFEVTLEQYKRFMDATGRDPGAMCWYYRDEEEEWLPKQGRTFSDPGFSQSKTGPALCLNYGDARAYAAWLSKLTGQNYRLPSEAEWEYAARAGTKTARYWGDGDEEQCTYGNGADLNWKKKYPKDPGFNPCDDGYAFSAPVGSFKPNAFGLYDMLGNSWELTQDCLSGSYSGTDNKGAPQLGTCEKHAIRGGSYGRGSKFLRAATRGGMKEDVRGVTNSIRLVREL
ncbi:SUMF1/EgtB/PvdO family nonheme iron enzyme [Dongia sedimenti]|uniref:SUMF1/EgtB/PvdO family nonheme iron enzyme n=1 Tax=Dongia sedimenti TaxID=3064282 RepID=A0ABU0YGJ8_9PROT|nr:SUMF1/EgtB/PvdO family nonheme iron enzyme [Rhodospirillaceae bacterium R-7]